MDSQAPSHGQDWPEWCVRQSVPGGRACVFVLAPSAAAAAVIANHLCGPMGGWRVGPDIKLDVFLRSEYHERCDAGDFTHMVEKRLRAEGEVADLTSAQ